MITNILLGTYTKKTSEGIYSLQLNTDNGQLSPATTLIKEDNPTYLAVSKADALFSVTKEGDQGGVSAYKKNAAGTYELVNKVLAPGAPVCYVAVDEPRQLVYGANYHKGDVTVYKINEDQSLTLTDTVHHDGSGPHENQASAHAHYADLTPDNRLVVCDLGTDGVYTYDVTAAGTLREVAVYQAAPGTGPRHLVFHPNNKVAYLFGELASTIVVLDYDKQTGVFTTKQTLSTLPKEHTDFNGGAAIRISADGKFLYASNRGHNSIVVYQIDAAKQTLTTIQHISTEGDFPRDFNLDPTGEFVVAVNQNTDNLTLYKRDQANGKLTLLQKDILAPEAVCVVFQA